MTAPDLSGLVPSKAKAVVGLIGSAVSFVVPYILAVEQYLPSPFPAVIGVVLFILSALGVYHAPFAPKGTVLVPEAQSLPPTPGHYQNPWETQ